MVSTSIGTNKSFLEQGINPNTSTNPEPTGAIFNAAKAFNQGLKGEVSSARSDKINKKIKSLSTINRYLATMLIIIMASEIGTKALLILFGKVF